GAGDAGVIRALARPSVGETMPDLTIMVDVPAQTGLARARARAAGAPDRFEAEGLAFHEALRQSFRDIAAAEPQRCVLVDGAAPPERVAQEIWRAVETRLPVAGGKADA
ncbi:MAG: dTMP kinase, partial [Beijerinckiaceae bacterium]